MSNIEIRLFQSFVTLCEDRNFARAADRLGIASPTLSQSLTPWQVQHAELATAVANSCRVGDMVVARNSAARSSCSNHVRCLGMSTTGTSSSKPSA